MIGQNTKLDAIIFVNGDTIYGNIIEVGTEEITYTYKGESIKNKTKTSALAKIDFANGRGQNFKGLDTFNRMIENERNSLITKQKKEEWKINREQRKKEKLEKKKTKHSKIKELYKTKKRWNFKLGNNILIPFNETIEQFKVNTNYSSLPGLNSEISYNLILNKNNSYLPSINIGRVRYTTDNYNYSRTLFGITNKIQSKINNYLYLDYGIKVETPSVFQKTNLKNSNTVTQITTSILVSTIYKPSFINNNNYYIFFDINIPFYTSINYSFGDSPFEKSNLLLNRYLTIGFGYDF